MKSNLRFLYNKYLIATLVFLAVMLFFDQNNWFIQRKRSAELKELEASTEFIKQRISEMSEEIDRVQEDPKVREKYAREKYKHKKPEEDLYLIIHDTMTTTTEKK